MQGVLVADFDDDFPAFEKGIRPGMAILQWIAGSQSGVPKTARDLATALDKVATGTTVALKVATKDKTWLVGLRASDPPRKAPKKDRRAR